MRLSWQCVYPDNSLLGYDVIYTVTDILKQISAFTFRVKLEDGY
jgi:hypothetical protein